MLVVFAKPVVPHSGRGLGLCCMALIETFKIPVTISMSSPLLLAAVGKAILTTMSPISGWLFYRSHAALQGTFLSLSPKPVVIYCAPLRIGPTWPDSMFRSKPCLSSRPNLKAHNQQLLFNQAIEPAQTSSGPVSTERVHLSANPFLCAFRLRAHPYLF